MYVGTGSGNCAIGVSSSGSLNWSSPYVSTTTAAFPYNNYTTQAYNYYDYINNFSYSNRKNEYFDSIFEYLTEEEIIPIIDRLQERGETKDIIKGIVNTIIQKRHVSEEFLLHYSELLDFKVVKKIYSSEIKSQVYPNIALLVQAE